VHVVCVINLKFIISAVAKRFIRIMHRQEKQISQPLAKPWVTWSLILHPERGVKYCDEYVFCLSVCLSARLIHS